MPIEFRLPSLGENVRTGDVVKVLVKEGDVIEANQGVCELETDKAVVEIPCPHAGRIIKVHFQEGQTVEVGQVLLTLAAPGEAEATAAAPVAPPAEVTPPQPEKPAGPVEAVSASSAGSDGLRGQVAVAGGMVAAQPLYGPEEPIPAGPLARRLARELGVDLRFVRGSGPGGRITPEDVEAVARSVVPPKALGPSAPQVAAPPVATASVAPSSRAGPQVVEVSRAKPAAAPQPEPPPVAPPPGEPGRDAWGPIRRERMSRIRLTIAEQMVRSVSNIPHVTNFDEADVTDLEQLRKQVPENFVGAGVKLTMMPFVMKAVAIALRHHPAVNASLDMERQEIIYKEYVHLGIAVDTPRGLVVPVVRNADRMSIPELARALATLAERARNAQFGIEELRGGTFTISNLGAVGGRFSTPIINYPEVAILLLGRSRWQPVVREGRVEPRFMLPLSLSYDHRLIDGATAQRFLNEVIDWLQSPGRLLLAE
ncbi:MAG: 2-oxo acid dehydrogenase subunit E2 [Thermoguttaceae bacterium]|nr:2-oxo acid dehydrogenase subunit E2 [Thermoguttaceae bacterium]MDW8077662.1 2-oxo acid dehydrogenase subunit E2 [Thermoguttaceae bacterium]